MREWVRYGEVGGAAFDGGGTRRVGRSRRARRSADWRPGERGAGPRPVRPAVVPIAVRPEEPRRPEGPAGRPVDGWPARSGPRVLVRRPVAVPPRRRRYVVRRAVAGVALAMAAAAVVVALGLLAQLAQAGAGPAAPVPTAAVQTAQPGGPAAPPSVVVAGPGETVWEVVDRIAPQLSGARRAAFAERIVTDNRLDTVRLTPGRVLHVPAA